MCGADRRRRAAALVLLGLAAAAAAAAQPTERHSDSAAALNVETFDFAWGKIADTYWDESMGGVDWQAVGDELRPRARVAADHAELRLVLRDMLSRLGASHFSVLPGPASIGAAASTNDPDGRGECTAALFQAAAGDAGSAVADAGPGFDVRFIGSTPLVVRVESGSSADRQGLRAGIEVVRVEDQSLAALPGCLDLAAMDPRGAARVRSRVVDGLLHGAAGEPVAVEFTDAEGARSVLDIERRHPPDSVEIGFGNLPPMRYLFESDALETGAGRVLVVRFNVWLLPVIEDFEAALYGEPAEGAPGVDAVLIDLRGNPGGVAGTAVGVAGYILEERLSLGTMKNRNTELNLVVFPRQVSGAGRRIRGFAGPLAVLIDGGSASTSELFAAGLQDHGRARLFGEPTAAAALPAVIESMPNGDLLMHAIADLERPGGERVEGRPVEPDSPVPLTREGLLAGRDEPRDAAIAWIVSELEGADGR